jgi:hypothetical protein
MTVTDFSLIPQTIYKTFNFTKGSVVFDPSPQIITQVTKWANDNKYNTPVSTDFTFPSDSTTVTVKLTPKSDNTVVTCKLVDNAIQGSWIDGCDSEIRDIKTAIVKKIPGYDDNTTFATFINSNLTKIIGQDPNTSYTVADDDNTDHKKVIAVMTGTKCIGQYDYIPTIDFTSSGYTRTWLPSTKPKFTDNTDATFIEKVSVLLEDDDSKRKVYDWNITTDFNVVKTFKGDYPYFEDGDKFYNGWVYDKDASGKVICIDGVSKGTLTLKKKYFYIKTIEKYLSVEPTSAPAPIFVDGLDTTKLQIWTFDEDDNISIQVQTTNLAESPLLMDFNMTGQTYYLVRNTDSTIKLDVNKPTSTWICDTLMKQGGYTLVRTNQSGNNIPFNVALLTDYTTPVTTSNTEVCKLESVNDLGIDEYYSAMTSRLASITTPVTYTSITQGKTTTYSIELKATINGSSCNNGRASWTPMTVENIATSASDFRVSRTSILPEGSPNDDQQLPRLKTYIVDNPKYRDLYVWSIVSSTPHSYVEFTTNFDVALNTIFARIEGSPWNIPNKIMGMGTYQVDNTVDSDGTVQVYLSVSIPDSKYEITQSEFLTYVKGYYNNKTINVRNPNNNDTETATIFKSNTITRVNGIQNITDNDLKPLIESHGLTWPDSGRNTAITIFNDYLNGVGLIKDVNTYDIIARVLMDKYKATVDLVVGVVDTCVQ